MRVAALVLLLWAMASASRVTSYNQELINKKLEAEGEVRVIMTFAPSSETMRMASVATDAPLTSEQVAAAWRQMEPKLTAHNRKRSVTDITVNRVQTSVVAAAALTVTRDGFDALLSMDGVVRVEMNSLNTLYLREAVDLVGAQQVQTPAQGGNVKYNGAGWVVAVLDGGFKLKNPMLRGQVFGEACFANLCPNGETQQIGQGAAYGGSDSEHGAHVAGIVLGNSLGLKGIAPGAKLLAIDVFGANNDGSSAGGAYDSDIMAGLTYVYETAKTTPIAAASLSLGGDAIYSDYCDSDSQAYAAVFRALKLANIAVVIAAGNESNKKFISSPACFSDVYAIGASSKADLPATFSNSNRLVKLFAPGVSIFSATGATTYDFYDGTSMATPAVSGAFAVLRSAYGSSTPVDALLRRLQDTGKRIVDPGNGLTFSRFDLTRALWVNGTSCGDGVRHPSEQCDDGNIYENDGCTSHCEIAELYTLKKGIVQPKTNLIPLDATVVQPFKISMLGGWSYGTEDGIIKITHPAVAESDIFTAFSVFWYDFPEAVAGVTQRINLTMSVKFTLANPTLGKGLCDQGVWISINGQPIESPDFPYTGRLRNATDSARTQSEIGSRAWCGVQTNGYRKISFDVSHYAGRVVNLKFHWAGTATPRKGSAIFTQILTGRVTAESLQLVSNPLRSQRTLLPKPSAVSLDTDRPGTSLPNMPVNARDASNCEEKCRANSECKVWTFESCGTRCWLKSKVYAEVKRFCRTTGVL